MVVKTKAAPKPETVSERDNAALKERIVRKAKEIGANLVGVAPVDRWEEDGVVPADYRPQAIWSKTRSVIVFGVPMLLPVIETTPSINYQEHYDTTNRLLDEISYRLANWLTGEGYASVSLPRDGYSSLEALLENPFASFSHTWAGYYAGLGTVGLARNLLVPEYGPRLRLNSVFTNVDLPGDEVLKENLCNPCGLCEKTCPTGAIRARADGLIGDLDKDACTRHHIELRKEGHWPCGVCVKVCPIGEDRKAYGLKAGKRYQIERAVIEANPDDPRFAHLVHVRRHGSRGGRLA
jgi:epoxyqueuosine reductase QueG